MEHPNNKFVEEAQGYGYPRALVRAIQETGSFICSIGSGALLRFSGAVPLSKDWVYLYVTTLPVGAPSVRNISEAGIEVQISQIAWVTQLVPESFDMPSSAGEDGEVDFRFDGPTTTLAVPESAVKILFEAMLQLEDLADNRDVPWGEHEEFVLEQLEETMRSLGYDVAQRVSLLPRKRQWSEG